MVYSHVSSIHSLLLCLRFFIYPIASKFHPISRTTLCIPINAFDWRFPSLRIHSYPKDQSTHAWKMHCMPTEIIAYQPIPVFQRLLHSNDIYFPYFQTRYTTLIMFNTVCSSSPNPVFTLTKVIARKKGKHWIGSPCHSAESS